MIYNIYFILSDYRNIKMMNIEKLKLDYKKQIADWEKQRIADYEKKIADYETNGIQDIHINIIEILKKTKTEYEIDIDDSYYDTYDDVLKIIIKKQKFAIIQTADRYNGEYYYRNHLLIYKDTDNNDNIYGYDKILKIIEELCI